MAGTYHYNSILKKESPQYAYALAILSGGIAFIVPQFGAPISVWLSYVLLAALMQAAGENIRESLKALLDAGADPHIKDHKEQTALRIAQKQGHTGIIKLLKEAEAKTSTHIEVRERLLETGNSKVAGKTHRVIKVCCGQHDSVDRYDVIPTGAALPHDCEETGREGNEEECRDYAWKNNIEELGWQLGF